MLSNISFYLFFFRYKGDSISALSWWYRRKKTLEFQIILYPIQTDKTITYTQFFYI